MRTEQEKALCKAFGEHLAKVRRELGWSQERLALEAGLARSYVGDVERGLRNIALVNIVRIADTLSVEVATLFEFRKRTRQATDEEPQGKSPLKSKKART
jgi:transcriptional regulator with XRE-family HTH domain